MLDLLFSLSTAKSHKIIHSETLSAFDHLIQQRRRRLDSVNAELPIVT